MEKPPNLYDRDDEWADLIGFVTGAGPPLRLGTVYGRRRFGKSWLLRRLAESAGGVYHLALQEERRPALDRFAAALSRSQEGSPPLRFDDWSAALGYAAAMLAGRGAGPQALVLDEYPYLRRACPELDSVLQALFDEAASGGPAAERRPPVAVIVCGSAMSVMTGVLSGASPMRGRAALDMPLAAFDYRRARGFWGIEDPVTAFMVDSIVGGAAGYKYLTAAAGAPARPDDVAGWLAAAVLNPSHALFREDEYLLREDPRITAEAPYYSLLQAIAEGKRSQGRIAAAAGRRSGDIVHHLRLMTDAGFVLREDDLLTARRPSYRIADPIVRFHHLVTRRHMALLEDRRAEEVWSGAADAYRSKVAGPHFETVCRRWVNRYASPETLGGPIGAARRLQVNDRSRRRSFELDIAAPTRSEGGEGGREMVLQAIGEAKAGRMDISRLARLDRIAELSAERKGLSTAPGMKRLLFSLEGFDAELSAAARLRPDVELIDPARLYEGS